MTADRPHADVVLSAVAELGPFFATTPDVSATTPDVLATTPDVLATTPHASGRWRPLVELRSATVLEDRVLAARRQIATGAGLEWAEVEERATASVVFLGWAARLLSPALGAAVLVGQVPRMASADWQDSVASPMPLRILSPVFSSASSPHDLAGLLHRDAIAAAVAPLVEAVGANFTVSDTVLWGNVASAIAGAAKLISHARPDLAGTNDAIVDALLSRGALAGKGTFTPGAATPRIFTRTTCCLFYRIPRAGTCGDCVLNTR